MSRPELSPEIDAMWPNCTVPDCGNKTCAGLSETLCTPHLFGLRMDDEGNAIYPSDSIRRAVIQAIKEGHRKWRTRSAKEGQR